MVGGLVLGFTLFWRPWPQCRVGLGFFWRTCPLLYADPVNRRSRPSHWPLRSVALSSASAPLGRGLSLALHLSSSKSRRPFRLVASSFGVGFGFVGRPCSWRRIGRITEFGIVSRISNFSSYSCSSGSSSGNTGVGNDMALAVPAVVAAVKVNARYPRATRSRRK